MDLPKNERKFHFSEKGDATQHQYEGDFLVKCVLDIGDKVVLGIEKSRITADLVNPTNHLEAIGVILSNLRVRIIESPEWWKQSKGGFDIIDENIISSLYQKALEQEQEWVEALRDKAKEKTEGNVKAES